MSIANCLKKFGIEIEPNERALAQYLSEKRSELENRAKELGNKSLSFENFDEVVNFDFDLQDRRDQGLAKTLKLSDSDRSTEYTVDKTESGLRVIDPSGKEPSTKTRRNVLDKYADDIDFNVGERASFPNDFQGNPNQFISENSNNPAEIADVLNTINTNEFLEGQVDYKTKVIADNIGGKIERSSYVNFGDGNNIGNSMARSYFSKKGEGRQIDTLAEELSEDYGVSITEQDIVEHMESYPGGQNDVFKEVRDENITPLKDKWTKLTGLPATDKFLGKAIDQSRSDDTDYQLTDVFTDEELINLYNEREQSLQETEQQESITGIREEGNESSDSGQNEGGSGVQEESGGSGQGETKSDNITQAQGLSGEKPSRNLSLTENAVKNTKEFSEKFRRFWNRTFRSNAGADSETARIIRSLGYDISAFTDKIEYEAGQLRKIIKDVSKRSTTAVKNQKIKAINEYLSRQDIDTSFLTSEQIDALDVLRQNIDRLSTSLQERLESQIAKQEERLSTGVLSEIAKRSIESSIDRIQGLIDTIENNKGVYLYRSYQAFSDPKYLQRLTSKNPGVENRRRIQNAVDLIMSENDGMSEVEARRQLFDYLEGHKGSDGFLSSGMQGRADAPFLKKRKEIPVEIRELLGESKEPLLNYVSTTFQISKYISNLEYQEKLADHLIDTGLGDYNAAEGKTKLVPDSSGWQSLQDIYVDQELANAIKDLQPLETVQDDFYKTWIKVAAFTKIGKTIFAPTTVARNYLSGIFLGINSGFVSGLKPSDAKTAFQQAWGTKKTRASRRAERDKLIRLGIVGDGALSSEILETLNDFSREIDRISNKGTLRKVGEFTNKVYAMGDTFYKVIGYYTYKDRYKKAGLTDAQAEQKAADRINDTFPTYSRIPKNIQSLRRIPLVGTFVSFPYEVLRTTNNAFKYVAEDISEGNTSLAAKQIAGLVVANGTLAALSLYTRSMLGIDDEDDDAIRDMLPEWQKNSSLIYVGKEGNKPVFIDGTALFPAETIIKPIRTLIENREGRDIDDKLFEATKELTSPYIGFDISFKAMIELLFNNDNFNRQIYKGENLGEGIFKDPDAIFNYYMKQAGPGVYNNISEFMRANNIAPETFGSKYTSYGREYTNRDALMALLGFRFSTLNYASGMTSSGYDAKGEFSEIRKEAIGKIKTGGRMSEEDVREIVTAYKAANNEMFEKLQKSIKGARKLGMTDLEISQALELANYSKSDVADILDGLVPLLKPISKTSEDNHVNRLQVNYDDPEKETQVIDDYLNNVDLFNQLILEE